MSAPTAPAALALSLDVSAVPARPGGAGYYTMELARSLSARRDISLTLISRRGDEQRWRSTEDSGARMVGAVPTTRPGRLVFEQVRFPRLLDTLGVAVHHGPHYTMPERAHLPRVVTIHDCTFFDHPEWHVRSKAAFFRRAIRRAALHADALVCVSEVTASRLRACCEVRAPIVVAPHGVDHLRFASDEPSPGADCRVLGELGIEIEGPLVVFIGTLEPRKGVAPLVAAFDRVADAHPHAALVLGGQTGWGVREVERAVAAVRHGDRILRTGYLPDEAVPALLRRSTVAVYPALAEGFGLPALEALACGAPLVTTEGTAMAEVAGGAAQLVPPGDVDALADALDRALAEGKDAPDVRTRRQHGLSLAAAHTWSASAERHVEAYRLALATPK